MASFIQLGDLPLWALLMVVFLFTALVGSFLNVVIYRLPIMMMRAWREEAKEILEIESEKSENGERKNEQFNLFFPRSACPNCHRQISALENIPIISYFLLLKGKCRGCGKKIPLIYPAIELITGLLSVWVIMHFGWNAQGWAAIIFVFAIIALATIDLNTQLLPDLITLPLMWVGILIATKNVYLPLEQSVWGAVIGYMSLWTIAMVFKLLTGKDGMGGGDMKLLAAFGAWMGVYALPTIVLIACVVGLAMAFFSRLGKGKPMPFGPALCVAGFLTFLYGAEITNAYLSIYGL